MSLDKRSKEIAFGIAGLIVVVLLILLSYVALKRINLPIVSNETGVFSSQNLNSKNLASTNKVSAIAAFNNNDFTTATDQAESALVHDTDKLDALLLQAMILAQRGSIEFKESLYGEQAIATARQVLALDPKNSEAWRIIGYSYEIMQNYAKAHDAYSRSLALNPQNVLTISQDAHAWDLQGNTAKAAAGYEKALSLKPDLDQALMGIGRILVGKGDLDAANTAFSSALRSSQNVRVRAEAAYSQGSIQVAKGNLPQAEQLMRQSVAQDPKYALGWAGLGTVLFSRLLGDDSISLEDRASMLSESFKAEQKAVTINPNQSGAIYQLGVQLGITGRTRDAQITLKAARSAVSRDTTLTPLEKEILTARIDSALSTISRQ